MGYHRAGFEVVGVDIKPQPHYPFEFHQYDALTFLFLAPTPHLRRGPFDAVHASPPCQAYSVATANQDRSVYPDLLADTRRLLEQTGRPWVIENVPGAPMRADYRLCGCMFGLPLLQRARLFETSWHGFALTYKCRHVEPALSVTGQGVGGGNGQRDRLREYLGRNVNSQDERAAMGIAWMTREEYTEAIPPAYTEFIGKQLLEVLA